MSVRLIKYFGLLVVLLFATSTRLFRLNQPKEFVFDERYHVPAIKLIAEKDSRVFEWWHDPAVGGVNIYGRNNHDWLHPPLAKYIQASFLPVDGLGNYEAKWSENLFFNLRFPAVIFGVMGVILVFCLAQVLFNDFRISLLASLILSLDGLWLVQSRLATNDIFVSVFILLSVLSFVLYLRRKKLGSLLWVGLALGLAIATKWSAFWIWLAILIYLLVDWLKNRQSKNKQHWNLIPWFIFTLIIVPIGVYLISYSSVFAIGGWQQFLQLHKNILLYQFGRDGFHTYASNPGQWFLNLRPVWYWTKNMGVNRADIYALGNPVISLLGVGAVFGLMMSPSKLLKKKNLKLVLYFYLASFLPWVFSPRVLFYYHYTPAVPFLSILLAWWIFKKYDKFMLASLITLMTIGFWLFYPHWLGLPVPKEFVEAVYFALPSWR